MPQKSEKQKLQGSTDPAKESSRGFYGSVAAAASDPGRWLSDTVRWLETSESTDPVQCFSFCCEDFKARRLKAPLVLGWLALQGLGLLYQVVLWNEVSTNLAAYEATLEEYCGPEHRQHGVCLGPVWNLSFSAVLSFPGTLGEDSQSEFDFVIPSDTTFSFETASQPPTFLLGVEPQPPHAKASWRVSIAPRGGSSDWGSGRKLPDVYGTGSKYQVLTSQTFRGPGWSGSLSLASKFPDLTQIHIYVVDSRIKHLEDVHGQPQCSFENSWENFNQRHSGDHHRILSWAQSATGFFLAVSLALVGIVFYRFFYYVESGKLLSRVIALKFLVQDFPQQMCIVAYIYSWYAANGLRCQMCLFHPSHCDNQHPLHWTNLLVCIFTLLGAVANQLLVQAKLKKYDEEEECFLCFARTAMLSISILPFSTGLFFLSAALLHLRSVFVYIVCGSLMMVGWGTLLCVPMVSICDEDL